jgi:hypothetical protein
LNRETSNRFQTMLEKRIKPKNTSTRDLTG